MCSPTWILGGLAASCTAQATPTISTEVVAVREPNVTVIFVVPGMHPEVSVATATPLQSVALVILSVAAGGGSKVPESASNVTIL